MLAVCGHGIKGETVPNILRFIGVAGRLLDKHGEAATSERSPKEQAHIDVIRRARQAVQPKTGTNDNHHDGYRGKQT
jgi:hypothetical protein